MGESGKPIILVIDDKRANQLALDALLSADYNLVFANSGPEGIALVQKVPAIDEAFFSAVHRERKKLTDEASIAAWVAEQGIDRAEFEKTYRSFSVQLQTKRADEQSRKVRLPSVPTIVVDGRYLVPIKDDGDFRDQLSILDTLIERARRERGGAMPASP